jgi:N-acetyltransferase B complex (NatB) non catalytic subunit
MLLQIRGPYLALVELAWRCKCLHLDVGFSSELDAHIVEYFRRFQSKAIAATDLGKYASALSDAERTTVCACVSGVREDITKQVWSRLGTLARLSLFATRFARLACLYFILCDSMSQSLLSCAGRARQGVDCSSDCDSRQLHAAAAATGAAHLQVRSSSRGARAEVHAAVPGVAACHHCRAAHRSGHWGRRCHTGRGCAHGCSRARAWHTLAVAGTKVSLPVLHKAALTLTA